MSPWSHTPWSHTNWANSPPLFSNVKHTESRSRCCHSESLLVTASSSAIRYYPESTLSYAMVVMMSSSPPSNGYPSFQDTVVSPFQQDIILFDCLGLPSCVLEKNNHCIPTYLTIAIYQFSRIMLLLLLFYCFMASILMCWQTTTAKRGKGGTKREGTE